MASPKKERTDRRWSSFISGGVISRGVWNCRWKMRKPVDFDRWSDWANFPNF